MKAHDVLLAALADLPGVELTVLGEGVRWFGLWQDLRGRPHAPRLRPGPPRP